MKIAIVGPAYPYRGGIAAFSDRLALAFESEGHDVQVHTFTLQYPSFLFPGQTQYSDAQPPQGPASQRSINSINPFNWHKIGKTIRKQKPDVVVFAYWMSFFAPCYGKMARIIHRNKISKCIGLIHNMMPHEPSILDKCLPPYFVKAMDGFVTLSQAVLDDVTHLDKQHKPKCFCPHPLYDHYGPKEDRTLALQNIGLNADYRYMLFFGLVRAYKGLDLLIDAFADPRLTTLPIRLIVAGEFYDEKQPYVEQIQRLGLQEKVILCDHYIRDEQVKDFFNASDIVVQPYRSATQSGVTQVAFHFEKPMLVTDVGGLKEIVPNNVIGYVTDVNPQSIADALVDFFHNNRKDEFEQNIAIEKQKYSWSKMTEAILNLIDKK